MAGVAKNQCFPLPGSHDLDPLRLLSTCVFLQVFERPDMMNLDCVGCASGSALFTYLGAQSLFEFGSLPLVLLYLIFYGRVDIPDKWNASPGCYQWFLSFTWHNDLKSFVGFPINIQLCLVFPLDFANGYLVFCR